MTTTPAQSLRAALEDIQHQETKGTVSASTVLEGGSLTPAELQKLELHARINPNTKAALAAFHKAEKETEDNPYARRALLRARIQGMEANKDCDPQEVINILYAAMSGKLSSGKDALKLFSVMPPAEAGKWSDRLYLPIIAEPDPNTEHKLRTHGLRMLVPTTTDDLPAFRAWRKLREQAAERLVEQLRGEDLINWPRVLWQIVHLFPDATIRNGEQVKNFFKAKLTVGPGDGLQSRRGGQTFKSFTHSERQILVILARPPAELLLEQLDRLAAHAELFWAGEIDCTHPIRECLRTRSAEVITPQQFQDGVHGVVAISNDKWKPSKDSKDDHRVTVTALFEQGPEGWRWSKANANAVRYLFHGVRLEWHDWSRDPIPPHIAFLLRTSTTIEP